MTSENTSRYPRLTAAAWVAVALLLGQAFVGSGGVPVQLFVPVVRWYLVHGEALRATSFVVAFASLSVIGALVFRATPASHRYVRVLAGLFIAALATSSATRQHYGDLSDAVRGVAQLVATIIGVYLVLVAGPRELARWRRTKYDERSADAAATALIATEDFLGALDAISSSFVLKGDVAREEGEKYSSYIRKWFGQRLDRIEPQFAAFRSARVQAQVYLEDQECTPLVAVADHYIKIVGALIEWTNFSEVEDFESKASEAYHRLFIELPKQRPGLLRAVKIALRPVARYRVPEPTR
jgi:hypothetical protein